MNAELERLDLDDVACRAATEVGVGVVVSTEFRWDEEIPVPGTMAGEFYERT